jgi:uncharacterized protein
MALELTEIEIRVLGSLMEKESTTPEYYPLSLNALTNACNQKSNRDPVLALSLDEVRQALDSLIQKSLAREVSSIDNRVPKYAHQLSERFNFDRRESALLCVLLLRGPQTAGELRGRTERMYRFDDLAAVDSTLQRLAQREPPIIKQLAVQPGTKEPRYAHLLGGERLTWASPSHTVHSQQDSPDADRISRLEAQIERLQTEVEQLQRDLAGFRKQFE